MTTETIRYLSKTGFITPESFDMEIFVFINIYSKYVFNIFFSKREKTVVRDNPLFSKRDQALQSRKNYFFSFFCRREVLVSG